MLWSQRLGVKRMHYKGGHIVAAAMASRTPRSDAAAVHYPDFGRGRASRLVRGLPRRRRCEQSRKKSGLEELSPFSTAQTQKRGAHDATHDSCRDRDRRGERRRRALPAAAEGADAHAIFF